MSAWGQSSTDPGAGLDAPVVWIFLGDLMAGMLGLITLLFIGAMVFQLDLATNLAREHQLRTVEQGRRMQLERALAGPVAEGSITIVDGRIGILGSLLFDLNSADLQSEGERLLARLAAPLAEYAEANPDRMIMVSGFTDDLKFWREQRSYADNWELSSERALTVTRALMRAGVPATQIFAAAFGPQHPVAPNISDGNRARNRRVEIVPVPRQTRRLPAQSQVEVQR